VGQRTLDVKTIPAEERATAKPSPSAPPPKRSLLGGLAAGGVAAIAASALSLALRSPDPVLINSASVSMAVLLMGVLGGIAWRIMSDRPNPMRRFLILAAGAFAAVLVAALLIEAAPGQPLPGVARYCIPVAGIALALVAALTPFFSRATSNYAWIAPLPAVLALVFGIALAGKAPARTGRLALPEALTAGSGTASAPATGVIQPADVTGLTFVVDRNQSKATYAVHEQLAGVALPSDAIGTTPAVSGTIYLDGRPSSVSVDVRTFKSDDAGRDRHLLSDPGLANFAPAVFTTTKLDLPDRYQAGETISRQVQGTMKLNNVERPLVFTVEARLDDRTLFIHGATDFTWKDFNIRPPSFSGVLQIGDTIHAEVLLVATAQT
jgi:polyisoprenoid-binding protein YceI